MTQPSAQRSISGIEIFRFSISGEIYRGVPAKVLPLSFSYFGVKGIQGLHHLVLNHQNSFLGQDCYLRFSQFQFWLFLFLPLIIYLDSPKSLSLRWKLESSKQLPGFISLWTMLWALISSIDYIRYISLLYLMKYSLTKSRN